MVALLKMTSYEYDAADNASLGAERRLFVRRTVRDCVEGRRVDHTIEAQRQPRVTMNLRDVSAGGLSAVVDMPLLIGERLSVCFPARGLNPGWRTSGRVLRCQPSGVGYRVAVEFDPIASAA